MMLPEILAPTASSGRCLARIGAGLALLATLLAGCATQPPVFPPGPLTGCLERFEAADRQIRQAGVEDQGFPRVPGFPFLRTSRLLASFSQEPMAPEQLSAWVGAMATLDADMRRLELRNRGRDGKDPAPAADLHVCRAALAAEVLSDGAKQRRLRNAAQVPDDYVSGWRVAGLYPLTAALVSLGIDRWHRETLETFALPPGRLPVQGRLQRWHSGRAGAVTPKPPAQDALGIPRPSASQRQRLFALHAPVWEVDVRDRNDLIGTPVLQGGPAIDTREAREYHYISHSRYGDRVLLQLNYVIWFRARPGTDIYAGDIDGLTWRVTLGPDGRPWLYDSIHNCGCYHLYFPTGALRLKQRLPSGEPPLVLRQVGQEPLAVRLDSARHFIQRVYTVRDRDARPLAVADYDSLLSLPTRSGYRSFFGDQGLVAGSERPERFILWPMGIRSPGAMRQRGRHAVAFVGRRHFDDPYLIETLFEETGN